MTENLISFETAKLAKEKGFDILVSSYYFEDGEFKENELTGNNGYYGDAYCFSLEEFLEDWNSKWVTKKNGDRCFGCDKSKGYFETYSAPTQSLLQKWLREVHNIIVSVIPFKDHTADVNDVYVYEYRVHYKALCGTKNTWEEALEEGLKESLNLIK